ncbi:MAG: hypothetical protein IJK62_13765 [Bacteroidales bacterium]|nr:hypothetical protein [Bacteroidales bacterium]
MKNIRMVIMIVLMIFSIPIISYAQDCGYSKIFKLFNMFKAGTENCAFKFKICEDNYFLIVCASRPSSYDLKMFKAADKPMLVKFSNGEIIELPFSYQFDTEVTSYHDWEWTWQYKFKTKEDFEKFVNEDIVKIRIEYKSRGIVDFTEKMFTKEQSFNKQIASKEAYDNLTAKENIRNNF